MTKNRRLTGVSAASLLLLAATSVPVAMAQNSGFRPLDPARTVYLDLPDGRVVIELNETFAPDHVARFLALVRDGFYDGLSFYRVIDGFVAQGGDGSDMAGSFTNPLIEAEFERPWSDTLAFTQADRDDPFAASTGFVDGFAVGRDPDTKRAWLVHCPGTVAMARNNGRDTASTDFYIVIGQAPRYLDRNMSIFGRVVFGMDTVQGIKRGPAESDGMFGEEGKPTVIARARIAADLPAAERLKLRVVDTSSEKFGAMVDARRKRTGEFYHFTPAEFVDVCRVPLATEVVAE